MGIRTSFLVAMTSLPILTGGLGLWLLAAAVSAHGIADRVEQSVLVNHMLFAIGDKLITERPTTADSLLDPAPVTAPTRARIDASR